MAQANTTRTTIRLVLSSAHFVRGFREVKAGKPFVEPPNVNHHWDYERGRLFACIFHGKLKQGRWATEEAVRAWKLARANREVL